jgi:hypothetical protein
MRLWLTARETDLGYIGLFLGAWVSRLSSKLFMHQRLAPWFYGFIYCLRFCHLLIQGASRKRYQQSCEGFTVIIAV